MKGMMFRFFVASASYVLVSIPISAHHGVTNYDMKKTIVLTGTVSNFDWANPHCLAHLDVADDQGVISHWTLEMNSTYTLSHKGWDRDTLKRGDHVSVETHPARNGAPVGITSGPGFALKVMVNGKEIPSP